MRVRGLRFHRAMASRGRGGYERGVTLNGSDTLAAVDLGSNSFHLVVCRLVEGLPHVVDRIRERVALAEGLDQDKVLTPEALDRGVACLERFGQRLAEMAPGSVRAVGTNTLRRARNTQAFLERGARALGHRIEIVAGQEEARLIYLGVAHNVEQVDGRRLVIDIGGGSTELILGDGVDVEYSDSMHMGCVSYTRRFFPRQRIDEESMNEARITAARELQSIKRLYAGRGWTRALGSSGTNLACEEILRLQGWSESGITREGLKKLRRHALKAGRVSKLELQGVSPERASVLPGGLAILSAIFDILEPDIIHGTVGALRDGVIWDQIGRLQHGDVRHRTVQNLAKRTHVDASQAERVELTALQLFDQVAEAWDLDHDNHREFLSWAARLHEIGLSVTHPGYHRHGAYLVEYSDLPGFSREGQLSLAALIGGHRRKFRASWFDRLGNDVIGPMRRLCVLLRVSVRLHRSRSEQPLPPLRLSAGDGRLQIAFPEGWLDEHPLTRGDLEAEAARLAGAGYEFSVS